MIEQGPVTADDFFDYSEDEMAEQETPWFVKAAAFIVFLLVAAFIFILLGKAVAWAWGL